MLRILQAGKSGCWAIARPSHSRCISNLRRRRRNMMAPWTPRTEVTRFDEDIDNMLPWAFRDMVDMMDEMREPLIHHINHISEGPREHVVNVFIKSCHFSSRGPWCHH